ncbi:MAG: hypothetical protein ABI581_12275 [Sediminibacterium sp.]
MRPICGKQILSLSNRIDQLLQITDTTVLRITLLQLLDTSTMLSPYLRKTAGLVDLDQMLKTADTTAMLAPYLRKSDTLSLSNRIDRLLQITDTAVFRANLLTLLDTSMMLSPYLRKSDLLVNEKIINRKKLFGNPSPDRGPGKEISLGAGVYFTGDTLNSSATLIDTFSTNLTVYAANGLGKYTQGQVIPAKGKTAAQVLMDAIMQTIPPTYTQPSVTVSSVPAAGVVETGATLSITLSAAFNQNDGGAQTIVKYARNGTTLAGPSDNISSITSPVSYIATLSYAQGPIKNNNLGSPDPAGQIAAGNKTSTAITFTPQAKRYWGYSSSPVPTDSEIILASGGGSELSSSKAKTSFDVSISGGSHYIFFAYPASLGSLNILTVGGFGSLPAFNLITRTFTNVRGYSQSYNIYVNTNAFSTPVSNIATN